MRAHTEYLWFNTKKRQEFIRITDDVARIVKASGVSEGMALVSAMHITAGVYVNDWEDGLIHDFQEGRDRVGMLWAAELGRFQGTLPGGHRVELSRVAGMQTGWGWVRADWHRALRDVETGAERRDAGYSHFWIEGGLIRRQRSIVDV